MDPADLMLVEADGGTVLVATDVGLCAHLGTGGTWEPIAGWRIGDPAFPLGEDPDDNAARLYLGAGEWVSLGPIVAVTWRGQRTERGQLHPLAAVDGNQR